ncbi:hypothetical protein LCGC14_1819580 [marine sediment metagenome]|uniref:Uncharacterized protein n=1 Tax=marine sediment metagenome TaxID=412755 RepID=A0A0F9GJE6_9ZZZZ
MKGMELLGLKVEDKVTKQKGIVTSIAYDLYGCIQVSITPEDKGAKGEEALLMIWYDLVRIKVLSKKPVIKVPDFEDMEEEEIQGPAIKPMKF